MCEEVCNERNIFYDDTSLVGNVQGPEDAREMAKDPEDITRLEERLKIWMKRVHEVLLHFIIFLNKEKKKHKKQRCILYLKVELLRAILLI